MTTGWLRRHRTLLALVAGIPVLLLVGLGVTGYALVRHFNANMDQVDVTALIGPQPASLHPKAENILVIGSHTGAEQTDNSGSGANRQGEGLTANQSGTLILLHIAASKKWAKVMAIAPNSYVRIPSCVTGDGTMSAPGEGQINTAFAIGSTHGGDAATGAATGAACTVKTVEHDTGIYVNHFIVINFTGFKAMVGALGGVPIDIPTAFDYPGYDVTLAAGRHTLDGNQALAYVRALSQDTDGARDVERLDRQTAFIAALLATAKTKWDHPVAIYRFLDAVTRSLTIDSQLGGIKGLYDLERSVHGMATSRISVFALPTTPRSRTVPTDNASVVWTQPQDDRIFAALRNDVPGSVS